MFLVEDVQRNIYDHRYVENELWKRYIKQSDSFAIIRIQSSSFTLVTM